MKVLERKMERKEREERKRNVAIKGLKVEEGKIREEIEEVMREIGARVNIKEMRKVGAGRGDKGEIVVVKLGNENERKEIMGGKKKLRRKKV